MIGKHPLDTKQKMAIVNYPRYYCLVLLMMSISSLSQAQFAVTLKIKAKDSSLVWPDTLLKCRETLHRRLKDYGLDTSAYQVRLEEKILKVHLAAFMPFEEIKRLLMREGKVSVQAVYENSVYLSLILRLENTFLEKIRPGLSFDSLKQRYGSKEATLLCKSNLPFQQKYNLSEKYLLVDQQGKKWVEDLFSHPQMLVHHPDLPSFTWQTNEKKENRLILLKSSPLELSPYADTISFHLNSYGEKVISIRLNEKGRDLFAKMTEENLGKQLAFFLDRELLLLPLVHSPIRNGKIMIQGHLDSFNQRKWLQSVLYGGSLPVPLEIFSEEIYQR